MHYLECDKVLTGQELSDIHATAGGLYVPRPAPSQICRGRGIDSPPLREQPVNLTPFGGQSS